MSDIKKALMICAWHESQASAAEACEWFPWDASADIAAKVVELSSEIERLRRDRETEKANSKQDWESLVEYSEAAKADLRAEIEWLTRERYAWRTRFFFVALEGLPEHSSVEDCQSDNEIVALVDDAMRASGAHWKWADHLATEPAPKPDEADDPGE